MAFFGRKDKRTRILVRNRFGGTFRLRNHDMYRYARRGGNIRRRGFPASYYRHNRMGQMHSVLARRRGYVSRRIRAANMGASFPMTPVRARRRARSF